MKKNQILGDRRNYSTSNMGRVAVRKEHTRHETDTAGFRLRERCDSSCPAEVSGETPGRIVQPGSGSAFLALSVSPFNPSGADSVNAAPVPPRISGPTPMSTRRARGGCLVDQNSTQNPVAAGRTSAMFSVLQI